MLLRKGLPALLALVLILSAGVYRGLNVRAALPVPQVLDTVHADYLEDEHTGRILAKIEAKLLRSPAGARLQMSISAFGAYVDPVPGFKGIRGSNGSTAREMETLMRDQRLRVETRSESAQHAPQTGTIREGRRMAIPERRARRDGAVELSADSPRNQLVELLVEGGDVAQGMRATEILLDGTPRLRVQYTSDTSTGKILSVKCLGPGRQRWAPKVKAGEANTAPKVNGGPR